MVPTASTTAATWTSLCVDANGDQPVLLFPVHRHGHAFPLVYLSREGL